MDTLKLLSRSSGLKLSHKPREHAPSLPSEGGNASIEGKPNSKKRKRDDPHDNHYESLDEKAIRQVQKEHNIRIMDIRLMYNEDSFESRKARKESSRLFPQPLQSFSHLEDLGVNQVLRSNVIAQGYKDPTAVQVATIPLLLRSGQEEPDLLTVAPTGSGKTLAFLIPLINKMLKNDRSNEKDRQPHAIILAPTKELVSQIVNEGRKMLANTEVRITDLRKGMKLFDKADMSDTEGSEDESDHESNGKTKVVSAEILVSTPLSLKNAITISSSETIIPLPRIQTLILDEADVLLDPLFREQTLAIWSACTSPDLRCSLWSATIGSSIEELSTITINDHYKSTRSKKQPQPPLLRTVIGLKDTSLPSISHRLIYASTEPGKLMGIRQLLHPSSSASKLGKQEPNSPTILRPPFLVFTQSIERAQSLYKELQYDIPPSAGGSTRIAVLHSSLSSKQRSDTMTSFRLGKIWILITTDLLSRGVDFRGVNGVVNYDIPTTTASYVHRAGRTGRAGRNGGICVTLYTKDDIKYLKPIANIISASEKMSITNPDPTISTSVDGGLPDWLISSLPHLTKQSKKELKTRGVDVRRGIKESDNDKERKLKLKNRIGTTSGYDRKLEDRTKGMKEGSRRRKAREAEENGTNDDEWAGLDD